MNKDAVKKINSRTLKNICVFCGSSPGNDSIYTKAAQELAELLVGSHKHIIYGGASVGLMGVIASACMKLGGEITGIIPKALADREVACNYLSDLRIVDSMHQRKAMMAEMADGFIALPGGLGTIEELFEMLTWGQLGLHRKPVGILNINGYFDKLILFLEHSVNHGFIATGHGDMLQVSHSPLELMQKLESYLPPEIDKAKLALANRTGQQF